MKEKNRVFNFFNRFSERIERAEDVHKHAQEVMAERREISKRTKAVIQKSEELLRL